MLDHFNRRNIILWLNNNFILFKSKMSNKNEFFSTLSSNQSNYQSESASFFDILKNNSKQEMIKLIRNNTHVWNYMEEGNNTGLHVAAMSNLSSMIKLIFKEIELLFRKEEATKIITNWLNTPNLVKDFETIWEDG